MRDSRIGAYGAAGLGLMLAAKVLALAATPPAVVPWLLIAAHAASRSSAVLVIATSAYVRDTGIARPVADAVRPGSLALALATGAAAICVLFTVAAPAVVLAGLAGLAAGHLAMRAAYERKLGGYNRRLPRRRAADERARDVSRRRRGDIAAGTGPDMRPSLVRHPVTAGSRCRFPEDAEWTCT